MRPKAGSRKLPLAKQSQILLASLLVRAQSEAGLRRLAPSKLVWSVSLSIVDAPTMTRLNGRYRKKYYATDVLSFPAPVAFRKQGMLGELVICAPTLKRQAREQGHTPEREAEILLAHGILHLLGLDHEIGPAQRRRMERWEAKLLGRRLGLIRRAH